MQLLDLFAGDCGRYSLHILRIYRGRLFETAARDDEGTRDDSAA